MILSLVLCVIGLVLSAVHPTGSVRASHQNPPKYQFAGQVSPIVFTGIWGYIGTASIQLQDFGSFTAHSMAKTNSSGTEFAVTGWHVDCDSQSCSTELFFLEYSDKNGAYDIVEGMGSPSGNHQFAVWGDGSGGNDGGGWYFNTFFNVQSGPNAISPTWVTFHSDLWHILEIKGEVYNFTSRHEQMGTVEYGWNGYVFLDTAVYDNGSTLWSAWDSRTTPINPTTTPYVYQNLASPDFDHFRVSGP